MNSIGLSLLVFLLTVSLIKIISATALYCNEDINGTRQLIENCRACVIFIDRKIDTIDSLGKTIIHDEPSIKELSLYDEKKLHHRHSDTIIHQKCAREPDGPLYGYDQTHCYCNSNRCNSNIQQCIYEIVSKRYFSCYHGSNVSHDSLEIYKKCRSCRIRLETDLTYHYECLTFGEQEQKNLTHCTCQYPMCNQNLAICQRFQQDPTLLRVNPMHKSVVNSTQSTSASTDTTATSTTTTTTITTIIITTRTIMNATINTTITSWITNLPKIVATLSNINKTDEDILIENATSIELTSTPCHETEEPNITAVEMKNYANYFSSNFCFISSLLLPFVFFFY
ncbi:unnamed protein product [Rotaria magnacalcarata]|uniref:Uncharacterized protein n=2 Tax=Rotaria magnacalcarata TaxID=392030 RepID=A0A819PP39_9BILA|nr:unnamed protein product [Rotaria magnacalcarata]CAF1998968.1 unnamed protein product [Rotaria magnacalcarata]CAF2082670.1 unnamed protein product [Rotaria magnacalcarata]CAF2131749.1 unnamed protein product [Rotaria magnacalcarata]CAF3827831.1 unnamed protein product [Rotaria magnacalcarata]